VDIFNKINGLDLFSGIGGISLALKDYVRPIAYCEIDPYCQGVLLSRMADESLCNGTIWDDIKTLDGNIFKGAVDIIYGGFPCQDISVAGHGKGLAGERSGLFYEIVRLLRETRPKFLFLENVPAITGRGGVEVVKEITKMGYDCRWCVISAASVGALHRRERWFLLAHAKHDGASSSERGRRVRECLAQGQESGEQEKSFGKAERTSGLSGDVANASSERLEGFWKRAGSTSQKESMSSGRCNDGNADSITGEQADTKAESKQGEGRAWGGSTGFYWPFESREHWQEIVSGVCRTSDGVPFHVHRLRGLGNSVVPQQVKKAFEILMGIK